MEHCYAVIMAGGGGTRLWPLSTREHPKQMLKIAGDRSMFQRTVDRLAGLLIPENILVVTTADQAEALRAQTPEIPTENFILEPMPKGTASVIGLAAIHLAFRDPQATMIVLPADHFIQQDGLFCTALRNACDAASVGHIVTLGIQPTFPSTGMGYIEEGEELSASYPLQKVKQFREKPDLETAQKFIDSGRFWWNAGMFIWRVDRVLEEVARFLPDLSSKLDIIKSALGSCDYDAVMRPVWESITPMTIDYGVIEKADDVVFLPMEDLGWDDIGSWNSIFDVMEPDENGNIIMNCRAHSIHSCGTLHCADQPSKLIVTVGLKDMIVVDTEKALLICPKHDSQRVREIVDYLKKQNMTEYC